MKILMKKLNYMIIFSVLRSFAVISLIFLPILYLSDFFFCEKFDVLYAIAKLPLRFGQSMGTILLWGAWLGVKNMKRRYGEQTFIAMGFRIKDTWPAIMVLSLGFIIFDLGVIVPANKMCPDEVIKTNWCLNKHNNHNNNNFFIYRSPVEKSMNHKVDLVQAFEHVGEEGAYMNAKMIKKNKFKHLFEVYWNDSSGVYFEECPSTDASGQQIRVNGANEELVLQDKDFYSIWNEPKKLSWDGLRRYKQYLQYHELDYSDITKQYHAFFSRAFPLVGILLCGFSLGWGVGIARIVFCAIAYCWLGQIALFFPLFWAIVLLWLNGFVWLGVGLWYLLL